MEPWKSMIVCAYLILLLIITKRIFKDWANPAVLMTLVWASIIFVYRLELIPLNRVENRTLFIIALGVTLFDLGVGLTKRLYVKIGNRSYQPLVLDFSINYKLILTLGIVSILLLLPDAINSIRLLISGGTFSYIRINNNETLLNNIVLRLIKNYISDPFIIFYYPFSAWCLLAPNTDKRPTKPIIIVALIISFLQMFSGGGRASIVYLVVYFAIMSNLLGNRFRLSNRAKRIIIFSVVIVAITVYYVSLSRGITNVGQSMIMYLCGCVSLLDIKIGQIIHDGSYTYGGAFLYGFLDFIFNFFDNLGFPVPEFMNRISRLLYAEQIFQIGTNISMNAFVSWFHALYLDGGYLALSIEAFIYGAISEGFYKRALSKNTNVKKMIGYAIISNTIVFSMVRFQFIKYHYLLAFIFIPLLIREKKCNSIDGDYSDRVI